MTKPPHGTGVSRLMRARTNDDRRQYHRFEQHGLVVRIGTTLHQVHDVSVGGIRVEALSLPAGTEVVMTLIPREGAELELAEAMTVRGHVVGHVKNSARICFDGISYNLAKVLIRHLARRHGVEPYILK